MPASSAEAIRRYRPRAASNLLQEARRALLLVASAGTIVPAARS